MTVLRLDGLTLRRGDRMVLSAATCAVDRGQVVVVIGPNGSGKTSLLMAAAGLLQPISGRVLIHQQDLAGMRPEARARLIAYVPQRSELIAPLLVREVVAMGRYAHGEGGSLARPSAASQAAITAALAQVDAAGLEHRRFTELSGGETQRVVIARALATGADCLVLDEPTSALDVAHRLALIQVIRSLAHAGKAVLIALHDLAEAAALADRVLLIQDGRVLADGPPAEVIAPGPIRAAYGVELLPNRGFGYALPS